MTTLRSLSPIIIRLLIAIALAASFIAAGVRTAAADEPAPQTTPIAAPADDQWGDDVDLDAIPHSNVSTWRAQVALEPGTAVVHDFDVVIANIYPSADQIPDTEAPMLLSESDIDSMLADAGSWWSSATQLAFDFSQNTQYTAINTTCDTFQQDSMAAYGHPFDSSVYTSTGRDLLIFQSDASCGDYQGQTYTVPEELGNVFEGGIFTVVLPWTGMFITDHTDEETYAMRAMALAHEFGHTIGLMHSDTLHCSSGASGDDKVGLSWDGHYLANCPVQDYMDRQTVMGNSLNLEGLSLNALQRRHLSVGWEDTLIDQPGTTIVTVSRDDKAHVPPKGAVILADGMSSSLMDLGIDFNHAVYLTSGYNGGPLETDLLVPPQSPVFAEVPDMQPLAPGQTYVSEDGRVSVRTVSQDSTSADVEITVLDSGVDSEVSVIREGSALTASTTAPSTAVTTYQWFRDGQPVTGATEPSYTPPVPDPNAVFRVAATFTDGASGPTVRYSRGIVADDHRVSFQGSTVTISVVDENGAPVQCWVDDARHVMNILVYDAAGELMSEINTYLNPRSPGESCTLDIPFTLAGDYRAVVDMVEISPLKPYWEPLEAQLSIPSTHASAQLFLGTGGAPNSWEESSGLPIWVVYAGASLPVFVSVTNGDGSPAVGVPVELSVPDGAGILITPATPVTDSSGLAYAELRWDRDVPPSPEYWKLMSVEAIVPGMTVESSPASFYEDNGNNNTGHILGWYEGDTTAQANGGDPVILHVRMWDDNDELISGDVDQLKCHFGSLATMESLPTCTVTWDPAAQDYVAVTTSEAEGQGQMWFMLNGTLFRQILMPQTVVFTPVTVSLYGSHTEAAASLNGTCDDGSPAVSTLTMVPVDSDGQTVDVGQMSMVFSLPADSPLEFVSDSTVAPDEKGAYHVQIASRAAGTFEVTGTLADGSMRKTYWMSFTNGPLDLARSSIEATPGPKVADGTDAYALTATLVSQCRAPIDIDAEPGKSLGLYIYAVSGPSDGYALTGMYQSHEEPGTYLGALVSIVPTTYIVTADYYEYGPWGDRHTYVNSVPLTLVFIPASVSTLSGIVTLDPAELTSGSTIATVLVVDSQGEPAVGVEVTLSIEGMGQFANGETDMTLPTDTAGQAVALVTATSDGCDEQGFDVSAIMTASEVPLAGSPVHATVLPAPGICGPTLTIAATPTNGGIVYANGADSWTGYFLLTARDGTPVTGGAEGFHSITVTDENGELAYWVTASNVTEIGGGTYAAEFTTTIPGTYKMTAVWKDSGTDETVLMTFAPAPAPPVVVQANAYHVHGTAAPGQFVQVGDENGIIWGPAVTGDDGSWQILTPPDTPSQQIVVSVVGEYGSVLAQTTAWLDADLPEPPRVDRVNATEVAGDAGAAEPHADVFVTFPDGRWDARFADENGAYSIPTPSDMTGGPVSVMQVDTAGNNSASISVDLVVTPPPPAPPVKECWLISIIKAVVKVLLSRWF